MIEGRIKDLKKLLMLSEAIKIAGFDALNFEDVYFN